MCCANLGPSIPKPRRDMTLPVWWTPLHDVRLLQVFDCTHTPLLLFPFHLYTILVSFPFLNALITGNCSPHLHDSIVDCPHLLYAIAVDCPQLVAEDAAPRACSTAAAMEADTSPDCDSDAKPLIPADADDKRADITSGNKDQRDVVGINWKKVILDTTVSTAASTFTLPYKAQGKPNLLWIS